MRPVEQLIAALETHGCRPRRSGSGWSARCPTHEDKNPSLGAGEKPDGKAFVTCFAGCEDVDVLAALGLTVADLYPERDNVQDEPVATYPYEDEEGRVIREVVRFPGKQFRQRRPDGKGGWTWRLDGVRQVPYRLREVRAGVLERRTIFVVEGEQDVERLRRLGFTATCNPGGAGKWPAEFASMFSGAKRMVILPDNDEPGRRHAEAVARSLFPVVSDVRIVCLPDLPEKGDVSDWLDAGGDKQQLQQLLKAAPQWSPSDTHPDDSTGLVLTAASDIQPGAVEWAWSGRVAQGALNLLVGVPGLGKTVLACDLTAKASRGELDGDLDGPATVFYLTAEDSPEHTLVPRLMAAGADRSRVKFVTMQFAGVETGVTLPDDVARLQEAVERERAALVVIDPVMAHLAGGIDSHRDHSIRRALAPLARMAEETGVAVLAIGHLNKAPSADLFSKVGGSIGLTAAARSILLVTPDPDADPEDDAARVVVHGKCNLGAMAPAVRLRVETRPVETGSAVIATAGIAWGEEAPHLRVGDVLAPLEPEDRSLVDECCDFLVNLLSGDGLPATTAGEECKGAGYSEATVRRAKKKLGVRSVKVGPPGEKGEWRWRLPEDAQETPKMLSSVGVSAFAQDERLRDAGAGDRERFEL